jgi:hypothetical protein
MAHMESPLPSKRHDQPKIVLLHQLLALVCISAAVFTTLAAIAPNQADGGGFPTATPTETQVPPTNTPLPYPSPTAPYPYPGLLSVNPLAVLTPTPTLTPKTGGFTLTSLCWPFAIAFILVVIIASTVYIRGKS